MEEVNVEENLNEDEDAWEEVIGKQIRKPVRMTNVKEEHEMLNAMDLL